MKTSFKVGARGSKLSIAQTKAALDFLSEKFTTHSYSVIPMETPGERDLATPIEKSPADFFTRDLDEAVLNGTIDFAIHSAKDLPYPLRPNLDFFWLPSNEDRRDAWVVREGDKINKRGLKVGVSSERRSAFVKEVNPSAKLLPIRGAIDSRIQQVIDGKFDAVLMAMAGINRLYKNDIPKGIQIIPISLKELPPPEAQGFLAVVFKEGNKNLLKMREHFVKAVRFVSAGVGNESLCTIAGKQDIENADIVLFDDLLGGKLIPQEKAIHVGKRCGHHSMVQNEITQLICDEVRKGKRVVRLKGGDAGLFGRLAEETAALEKLQIPFVVRPGVSALTAATTGTGMLLTRRGESRGFSVETPRSTGSEMPSVMFMAVNKAIEEAKKMIEKGMSCLTPCAIVFDAAGNNEEIKRATLGTIQNITVPKGNPPGLLIIGNVTKYGWGKLGLFAARKVLITCSETIMPRAVMKFEDFGARAISWPLIDLSPSKEFKDLLNGIGKYFPYDAIVLTSPSAARIFFSEYKGDVRKLPLFFTCGAGTDLELRKFGVSSDVMPEKDFSAKGLIEEIKKLNLSGKRVLRLRSEKAGKDVASVLKRAGAKVDDIVLYENSYVYHEKPLPKFNDIYFASASAVESFVAQYGIKKLHGKKIYVMGEPTKKAVGKILPTAKVSIFSTVD